MLDDSTGDNVTKLVATKYWQILPDIFILTQLKAVLVGLRLKYGTLCNLTHQRRVCSAVRVLVGY